MTHEDFTTDEGTVFPIVHLNGTGKERLAEQRIDALRAIRAARKKLQEMAPNGRDYYPVDGLRPKAIETHRQRLRALMDMEREIDAELAGIIEQW